MTIKKEKNVIDTDSDECGDVYSLTAMKTDTRLFISHHEGDRTLMLLSTYSETWKEGGQFILQFLYLPLITGILSRRDS